MNTQEKQIISVTQEELLLVLMSVEKPTFTNIVMCTVPKMNKGNNPYFGRLVKKSKGNFFIGGDYERMVIEGMIKEGLEDEFKSEKCTVGEHLTKCIQYNEKLNRHYLQYYTYPSSNIKSTYEVDGVEVEKDIIRPYLTSSSSTSRQPQEKKVNVKSLMLSSIKQISLGGKIYQVTE